MTKLGETKVHPNNVITLIQKTKPFLNVKAGDMVQFVLNEKGQVIVEKAKEEKP